MTLDGDDLLSSTRERFAADLEQLLGATERRGAIAVVVSGEPGLGKTATLEAVRQRWERAGGTTLSDVAPTSVHAQLVAVRPTDRRTQPLVLVDDIDRWGEPELVALSVAIGEAAAVGVRLLASSQNGTPAGLEALSPVQRSLPRLPDEEIEELLAATGMDDADRISAVVARSGGNPWVAQELAAADAGALLEADPLTVPETVARRFHQVITDLPGAVRRSLVVVAAADGGDLSLIDKALGVLGESLPDLDEAESAGLVGVADGRVWFTHPVLRTVSYRSVGLASRRAAHAALATVMSLPAQAAGRAHHLVAASDGPDDAVADALMVLGEQAATRGVHREAAEHFERAARFSEDHALANRCLARAALGWRMACEASESRRLLREVDRAGLEGHLLLALCELDRWVDGPTAALSRLDIGHFDDPSLATALRSELTLALFGLQAADRDSSSDARADQRDTTSESETGPAALGIVRARITGAGPSPRTGDGSDPGARRWFRAQMLAAMNENGLAPARDAGSVEGLLAMAHDSLLRCDLVDAERSIEMARALHPAEAAGEELDLLSVELLAAQLRGVAAAATWAPPISQGAEPAPAAWLWAMGRAALELGEEGDQEAIDLLRRAAGLRPDLYAAELIAALAHRGRSTEANEWLEQMPERDPERAPLQAVRRSRAEAIVRDDDRRFRLSADLANDHGLALDRFESLLAQAESLSRGMSEEARKLAGLVAGGLGRRGVKGWHRRTDEVARSDSSPPIEDSLTRAELRVATSVAGGGTNKQVADELYLSVKTVDYHLQNIYRKLGIRSRTELAVIVSSRKKEAPG